MSNPPPSPPSYLITDVGSSHPFEELYIEILLGGEGLGENPFHGGGTDMFCICIISRIKKYSWLNQYKNKEIVLREWSLTQFPLGLADPQHFKD